MKGLVAALFLLVACLYAVSAQPSGCCTVDQWSSMGANWDPQKKFFAIGAYAYDYTNSREFYNAIEEENGERVNVTYIILFKEQIGYRIYNYFGGDRCKQLAITGAMPKYCIPSSARYLGNYTLGGTLGVNVYEYIRGTTKGTYQTTTVGCIPVKNTGVDARNPNYDQEEFFNYVPSVNPAVFTKPNFC